MDDPLAQLLLAMAARSQRRLTSDDAASEFDLDDLSIPIDLRGIVNVDPLADDLRLRDKETGKPIEVYRGDCAYVECRIAVIGLGDTIQPVLAAIGHLDGGRQLWDKGHQLWTTHRVVSFSSAQPNDVGLVADRLAMYQPNYVALVVSGTHGVRSPQEHSTLTRYANAAACAGRRRPYGLYLVVDELLDEKSWLLYLNNCRAQGTTSASSQCQLANIGDLGRRLRNDWESYCRSGLEIVSREETG